MDERRTRYLLIAILLAQLVLLAIQGARGGGTASYLERAGLRVLGPAAHLVAAFADGFSGLGRAVRLQSDLRAENSRLRRQVEELRLKLLRLSDVEEEMGRLGAAMRYSSPLLGEIRAVDVVYADYASWLRTLVLYCGEVPAAVNQPVLAPAGLVGRVVAVSGPYAKVQLITDRAALVGGMIVRNRQQGLVRGSGQDSAPLSLDYVPLPAEIRPGDRVITAGIDGVYPRGIPVGTVLSVESGGQLFHKIRLAPAVDFGTLDQVFILEHAAVPQELREAVPGARR